MKNRNVVVNYQVILNRGLYRWAAPRNVFVRGLINDGIQDLQRLSCSLRNRVRGRFQIKFAMTSLFNKSGFTLIELLVVVLIIGILAAIALPQYQKAVEKSRIAEAVTVLNNLRKSYQLCVLEYGNNANECGNNENGFFSHLSFDISAEQITDRCDYVDGCYQTSNWLFDFDGDAIFAISEKRMIGFDTPNGNLWCQTGNCDLLCNFPEGENRCYF